MVMIASTIETSIRMVNVTGLKKRIDGVSPSAARAVCRIDIAMTKPNAIHMLNPPTKSHRHPFRYVGIDYST
jgi:hypothetical protein